MNRSEAVELFRQHRPEWEARGVILPDVQMYLPEEFKRDSNLAMDALISEGLLAMDAGLPPVTSIPAMVTNPNAGIPVMLTTMIDPQIYEVLFAPNRAAEIFGEVKKFTWVDQTGLFPVVEHVGEVTTYGDYAEAGHTEINTNFPARQQYLYQTFKEWGQLQLARYALAKIQYASEVDKAAATVFNKFLNASYFFGIAGLQNYGLLNDPELYPNGLLTPAAKAYGGTKWLNGSTVVATANEIFNDIQAMVVALVAQNGGLLDSESSYVLAMAPNVEIALNTTNAFNVNVHDLLKKNFPKMEIETAVQYGTPSTQNNQGFSPAGNLVQLIAKDVEGQEAGYCAFSEKMRSFPVIVASSSYKQKVLGGTWGCIVRLPSAIMGMIGV
jgi:hypothetical protein